MVAPLPLLLALLAAAGVQARRHAPDLREDEPARRTQRPAECQFGKQAKELGSTWFADLGPPFGVMYCIKCECIPVQKKRRIMAKVQCRNIKNQCPEPTCENPVLLPRRCCKTCPGDVNSPDIVQEDGPMIVTAEEDELSMKQFGALLTARSPLCIRRDDMSAVPTAAGVATARFTFRRRHLYWSVLLGNGATPPRALLFLDRSGRVLLEQPLKKYSGIHATYEDATDKLCGVWRRVPREYKKILRDGSLYVGLVWGNDKNNSMESALSGKISRYPALVSEMFSALLEPEDAPKKGSSGGCEEEPGSAEGWWGGTAIVTGVAGAAPSLHVAVLYNGIFPTESAGPDFSFRLLLTAPDKNQTILDELHQAGKPAYEINVLEVSTPVTAAELRSLSRGHLMITLEAVGAENRRIKGWVRQRATCEVFQAALLPERIAGAAPPQGLAMMYIDKDGSLVYDIQTDNLVLEAPHITLVDEVGKRHSQVELLNTMVGVLARPSARIYPPLYDELLALHIGTDNGPPSLRGRFVSRPLPDAAGVGPVLLRRTDDRLPQTVPPSTFITGLAWIAVDNLCGIHYEVSVSGGDSVSWLAWLETRVTPAPGGVRSRALPGADGCVLEPAGAELAALHAGASYLDLRDADNTTTYLRARLPQINVPVSCLPAVQWTNDNELTPSNFVPSQENTPPDNSLTDTASCYYAERFYEDGAQWLSTESCHICGCVHGRVRCDAVRCPPVPCSVPTIQPTGQCCPICTNSTTAVWNESKGCHLAGQYHAPGSSWHPYLVPSGYDSCAICTCDFPTRAVRCTRVRCPPLKCSDKEAYRPDKKACCRVCPEVKEHKSDEGTQRDEGAPKTATEILAEGGCVFPEGPLPNGKEVHPSIHSHGEQKCVTCRCKDGVVTCVRKRCGRGACSKRRRTSAPPDPCCVCARHRRHRMHPT